MCELGKGERGLASHFIYLSFSSISVKHTRKWSRRFYNISKSFTEGENLFAFQERGRSCLGRLVCILIPSSFSFLSNKRSDTEAENFNHRS